MPPRSSSPICERSLDLTLIGIGRRDIPQCSSKQFHTEAFYRTFSGGQRPSRFASPASTKRIAPTRSGSATCTNKQFTWSTPFSSQDQPGFAWCAKDEKKDLRSEERRVGKECR